MSLYGFHPDASHEFTAAIDFYAAINPKLAGEFISEVEHSITVVCRNPGRYRVVDGDVRRCLMHRFPYGLYYTFDNKFITFWAVMHLSREPGYWKQRLAG